MSSTLVSRKYPSVTVLKTRSNNYVIPHHHPEYGPTIVRKHLGLKKCKLIPENTQYLSRNKGINFNHTRAFHTIDLPPEKFPFSEFYHNKNRHDSKYELKCLKMNQKDYINRKYASCSDIKSFMMNFPFMANSENGDEQFLELNECEYNRYQTR